MVCSVHITSRVPEGDDVYAEMATEPETGTLIPTHELEEQGTMDR